MQQDKKDQQQVQVNAPELLNRVRQNVKMRFEEHRQAFQKQQQEGVAQLKKLMEALYSTQAKNVAELENDVLNFIDNNEKNYSKTSQKFDDTKEYSETDSAESEEQYNETNYNETDFGDAALKYSTENAGHAMQYTEQRIEETMETINDSITQMEKITEGVIY